MCANGVVSIEKDSNIRIANRLHRIFRLSLWGIGEEMAGGAYPTSTSFDSIWYSSPGCHRGLVFFQRVMVVIKIGYGRHPFKMKTVKTVKENFFLSIPPG